MRSMNDDGEDTIVAPRATVVAIDDDARVLDAIVGPDAMLAVWTRPPLPSLSGLDLAEVDDIDGSLTPGDLPPLAGLTAAGYPPSSAAALAEAIGGLAARHAALLALAGAPPARLAWRLDVVETDACRRFHADYVTLRMIATLVGAGTQWRAASSSPRDDTPDGEVPTGAVAVFKGRRLADPPTLLHRSPPIAGTGARRLLLMIDPAPDATGD